MSFLSVKNARQYKPSRIFQALLSARDFRFFKVQLAAWTFRFFRSLFTARALRLEWVIDGIPLYHFMRYQPHYHYIQIPKEKP